MFGVDLSKELGCAAPAGPRSWTGRGACRRT